MAVSSPKLEEKSQLDNIEVGSKEISFVFPLCMLQWAAGSLLLELAVTADPLYGSERKII